MLITHFKTELGIEKTTCTRILLFLPSRFIIGQLRLLKECTFRPISGRKKNTLPEVQF